MRLAITTLTLEEVRPRLRALVDALAERVPAGVGCDGFVKLGGRVRRCAARRRALGRAPWLRQRRRPAAHRRGGVRRRRSRSGQPSRHSERPRSDRHAGIRQPLSRDPVARPEHIADAQTAAASAYDRPNQIAVMFHCGSRGFGHQVASDYLQTFLHVMRRHMDRGASTASWRVRRSPRPTGSATSPPCNAPRTCRSPTGR